MIRKIILKFDRRMQEIINTGNIMYGKGRSKPCAELRFDKQRNSIVLFLWIPQFSPLKNKKFGDRMKVWTDWNSLSDIGYVAKGVGRMINEAERKLGTVLPLKKLVRGVYIDSNTHKYPRAMNIEYYLKPIGKTEESNSINVFLNLALKTWIKRL